MITPQIILNCLSIIIALAVMIWSYFMIFYTTRVIEFYSKMSDLMFFNPFSKNRKIWCQKRWYHILIKITGVITFFFVLLCLFVEVHNIIAPK